MGVRKGGLCCENGQASMRQWDAGALWRVLTWVCAVAQRCWQGCGCENVPAGSVGQRIIPVGGGNVKRIVLPLQYAIR